MSLRAPAACLSLTLCTFLLVPVPAAAQAPTLARATEPAAIAASEPMPAPVAESDAAPTESNARAFPAPDVSFAGLVDDLLGDFRRLPSRESATLVSLGAMAAFMGGSVDSGLSTWLSGERALGPTFQPGNIIGGYQVQLGGALATYTLGRLADKPRVALLGADLLRAHIVTQTVTGALKFSVRRTRPDGTHLSFPSGHTSTSFASATVLQRHFGWKVGVPAMAVATYVAAARIQEKRHFLSDVAFGAALGIAAGRTVTIGRGPARFALAPMATPGGAGVAFTHVGR